MICRSDVLQLSGMEPWERVVEENQPITGNIAIQALSQAWTWFENLVFLFWSGLGWPHTTLIICFMGLCFFRVELRDVISRIKSVGTTGFEVRAKPQKTQGVAPDLVVAQPSNVDFPYVFGLMLESVDKDISNISSEDVLEALRQNGAFWRTVYVFENIYSFIFGGQLGLLWMLNQLGDNGMPMADVEREWVAYKERFKPHLDSWEMGPFLKFLYVNELAEERDGVLRITIKGKEFLVWMTKTGRSSVRLW